MNISALDLILIGTPWESYSLCWAQSWPLCSAELVPPSVLA